MEGERRVEDGTSAMCEWCRDYVVRRDVWGDSLFMPLMEGMVAEDGS